MAFLSRIPRPRIGLALDYVNRFIDQLERQRLVLDTTQFHQEFRDDRTSFRLRDSVTASGGAHRFKVIPEFENERSPAVFASWQARSWGLQILGTQSQGE